jgi:glycosyltransferase involved in cell wall biosynthesis
MSLKKVSIIIPAYNAEKWIGETLESALAQTWSRKEVIVVDDGSRDNTLSVAQGLASAKVKVLRQDNAGASAARNRGLALAQGELIQFLDADDLLAPDKVARQMQTLAAHDSSV